MVDRRVRDAMAEAIRAYMNDRMGSSTFGEALDKVSCGTEDLTAFRIAQELSALGESPLDYRIAATKAEWDYLNRVLLLLESDAGRVVVSAQHVWHPAQALAAVALFAFLVMAWHVGWGNGLLIYALPFGLPSMLAAWFRNRGPVEPKTGALTPFSSIEAIFDARRHVPHFVRRRYSAELAQRSRRRCLESILCGIPALLMWSMASPLILAFQMLPRKAVETTIRMSSSRPRGSAVDNEGGLDGVSR